MVTNTVYRYLFFIYKIFITDAKLKKKEQHICKLEKSLLFCNKIERNFRRTDDKKENG